MIDYPRVRDRLLLAAMTSPHFWSVGAEAARSTHAWIRRCYMYILVFQHRQSTRCGIL